MKQLHSGRRATRGFTIVEVIMTFIIIGVLTAILVPTIANRASDAKITATQSDLGNLADAQERAAIDTAYFFRIYALNDVRGGDGVVANAPDNFASVPANQININGLSDNDISTNNIYNNPDVLTIIPSTGNYAANSSGIFADRIKDNESNFHWNGPYINWQNDKNQNDWPDDPYGNDYLFFTRVGVIYPTVPTSVDATADADVSDIFQTEGPLTTLPDGTSKRFEADLLFDRPTFLSLGANGLPGNGTNAVDDGYGRGDDIYRSFGGN